MKYIFGIFLFFLIINPQLFCASQQQSTINVTPQMVIVDLEWLQSMLSKGSVTEEKLKEIIATGQKKFTQLAQQAAVTSNIEAHRRSSAQLTQSRKTNELLVDQLQQAERYIRYLCDRLSANQNHHHPQNIHGLISRNEFYRQEYLRTFEDLQEARSALKRFKETEENLRASNTQLSEERNALRIECEVLKRKLIYGEEFDLQQHDARFQPDFDFNLVSQESVKFEDTDEMRLLEKTNNLERYDYVKYIEFLKAQHALKRHRILGAFKEQEAMYQSKI